MKLSKILLAAGIAFSASLPAQQINPITQAMLDGYEQLLRQDPKDYLTYYERAAQYYRLSRYDLALEDIKHAIEYTPAKDKAQLASVYSLCADIYIQLGEYAPALRAIDNALLNDPDSYPLLYTKGNICLYTNDYEQADRAFRSMLAKQPRSQEAVVGLAKSAIMQGNTVKASSYIEQAEKLDPSNYLTFCRVGDLHADMKQTRQAAADYISAFCLNSSNERPMSALINLSRTDYPAVMEAVDYALGHTNNTVPLNFLKGNIAYTNGRYTEAYEAFRQLPAEDEAVIAPALARVCLGMGNASEADKYAIMALKTADNMQNNLTKALIEESVGNLESGAIYAEKAVKHNPHSVPALIEAAMLRADSDVDKAIRLLNEALLYEPANREALLLKASLTSSDKNMLRNSSEVRRAIGGDALGNREIMLKALAQYLAGMTLDADTTIGPLFLKADSDAEAAIYSALYYLNIGDKASAAKFKKAASKLDYEDAYMLEFSRHPILSLRGVE